jgi:plastocyanin domain-containing protein
LAGTASVGGVLLALLLWPEAPVKPVVPTPVAQASSDNRVELRVTETGFVPSAVRVHAGTPVTLVVTRMTDTTCATEILIPDAGVKVALPLRTPVTVRFVPPRTGTLRYGCGMQMMVSGVLLVE